MGHTRKPSGSLESLIHTPATYPAPESDGPIGSRAMARDGHDCHRGMAGRIAVEAASKLGFLVVPAEQRAVGDLGMARAGLCPDRPAAVPGCAQRARRPQERS